MRRALYWAAVLLSLAALVGGGGYAYVGRRPSPGPTEAVTAYLLALARSDAPAALALGVVPPGPHDLLTSAVLAEQEHLAPLRDVQATEVARRAGIAVVRYSYSLRFSSGSQHVTGTLRVQHVGSAWRLERTAVTTTIRIRQGADRVALAGSVLPHGPTLLFPGALPVRVDTPYLRMEPRSPAVRFGAGATSELALQLTTAARAALTRAVITGLRGCVSGGSAAPGCPLPSSRVVPGSLRGRIVATDRLRFRVDRTAAAMITVTGTVTFHGRYQYLDYVNVAHSGTGRLPLRVNVSSYPVAPLTIDFAVPP